MSKTDVSLKYLQCPPKNRLRSRPTAPPPWRTTRAKVMRAKGGKCFRIYFFAESVFYALQDLQNSPRSFVSFDTSPFLFRPPKKKNKKKISSSSISRVPSNLPVCFLIRPKLKNEQTFFYLLTTTQIRHALSLPIDRPALILFIAPLSLLAILFITIVGAAFSTMFFRIVLFISKKKKMKILYLRYITTTIHFHHSHFLYPALVLTFQFIYFFFFFILFDSALLGATSRCCCIRIRS